MILGVERTVTTPSGAVSADLDGVLSERLLVLAHGAGAGKDHPFMRSFAQGLAERGIAVLRFNFLYTEVGKKSPDRQPVLEETFRSVVDWARQELEPGGLFLGGKSMGGRIASHLAADGEPCDGLVFLGYPLHPPGRPDRMRDEHLYGIKAPLLFVEGTRDAFCPLDLLQKVRAKLRVESELYVVEDGDHSFKVRRSSGRTSEDALQEAIAAVAGWITER